MTMLPSYLWILSIAVGATMLCSCATQVQPSELHHRELKALIIDGENNHGIWPMTTMMLRDYLLETDLFEVDIARKKFTWQGPHSDGDPTIGTERRQQLLEEFPLAGVVTTSVEEPVMDETFHPAFEQYDLIISNLGWKSSEWPSATKRAFENYIDNGGGLMIIHAANNAWGDWEAYNRMIGVGGWGGRAETYGRYAYYNKGGEDVRDPSPGPCGSHGAQQEYLITMRERDHPIAKGLPETWLHTQDELYERLRGPAIDMTILGTAFSDKEKNAPPWDKSSYGSDRHEPMLSTIDYGKGRIVHNAMGHSDYSMECVGFITLVQRGAEWAATGKVTQPVPSDFPTATETNSRKWVYTQWK